VLGSIQLLILPILLSDMAGELVPSLDQRFAQSAIVAVVRIESGETELYHGQVYKARVLQSVKGTHLDVILYFRDGNMAGKAYELGELYLLLLRPAGERKVRDAHIEWASPEPASRFLQSAPLYAPVCGQNPIALRYRNLLDEKAPVFFVDGGCLSLPDALLPKNVGSRGDPFLMWVRQDPLLGYLKALATQEGHAKH
jgi:hypothetical protein